MSLSRVDSQRLAAAAEKFAEYVRENPDDLVAAFVRDCALDLVELRARHATYAGVERWDRFAGLLAELAKPPDESEVRNYLTVSFAAEAGLEAVVTLRRAGGMTPDEHITRLQHTLRRVLELTHDGEAAIDVAGARAIRCGARPRKFFAAHPTDARRTSCAGSSSAP